MCRRHRGRRGSSPPPRGRRGGSRRREGADPRLPPRPTIRGARRRARATHACPQTVLDSRAVQASETPTFGRVRPWELGLVAAFTLALYIPLLGSYNFWDPWETHYGEVARRMLEEHDWVKLRWQNESFRSKPVLTFWLMGAGMKLFGVANDGGFSGEMVSSSKVEWSIRLPFALFGCAGVICLWYALARLYSKRAAWLAAIILATCPYYFFISRQAITDMPSCALLIGSMALFALAIFDDRPVARGRYRVNAT